MALIYAGINLDIIKLIGRWYRGEILNYLHVKIEPAMRKFSSLILSNDNYNFLPHHEPPFY